MSGCSTITTLFPRCLTSFLFAYTGIVTILSVDVVPSELIALVVLGLIVLCLYTYAKVIYSGAGSPLDFPELRINDIQAAEDGIELPPRFLSQRSFTLKHNGRFRFCRTCRVWKPDRCHHCSACNKCFLKMDHHCPWFPVCIGFNNQKYFMQFLIYTTFYAIMIFYLSGSQILNWIKEKQYERETINLPLLVVWLLSVVISISLIAFTSYTGYMLTRNQTTIEMYEHTYKRDQLEVYNDSRRIENESSENIFDLGSRIANWECVMGRSWLELLLPMPRKAQVQSRHTLEEKGLFFKVNNDVYQAINTSRDLQEQLMRRLTPRSSSEANRF
ncbi:LAFE_0G18734g1_1 [Lachancea fermentati]|uniref:Palmitoyltransferase n=1 Tax=Lachancea fermentati TaxID=4955 RepID=A0A1G4MIW6_LACFM|nr:LAFE_0G18734g1_1 [Lachancea fermentati]